MAIRKIIFFYLIHWAESYLNTDLVSISITRQHKGDTFYAAGEKCYKELCIGLSSGTAGLNENKECECKCEQRLPVYRDDLNVCVDDIKECSLVPFVSGSTIKKIPYVFLPLKGQIVYPSAEIVVSDIGKPVCVVSGGQFLGRNGWMNLKNSSGTEIPFRLFRDEGRTYLQWFGEPSLRMAMEGRIILVHLLCKDGGATEEPKIFTPCIAFRIAGSPVLEVGTREVLFATDVRLEEEFNGGLSIREYVAIGLCSLFLAVVYVASVFLYLNWRKRKNKNSIKEIGEEAQLTLGEEGIIKNNPLLQADQHLGVCGEDNNGYTSESNSCCSEGDHASDLLCLDDEDLGIHQNVQTSALIHPCEIEYAESVLNQDPNSMERLPEENVSIVETIEGKEVHPEAIKAITSSNGRRKLYFNPSYFDPDLLKAPPPAALEFLQKIREVIAIAKHKMLTKKFFPSLLGIPEEDGSLVTDSENMRVKPKKTEQTDLKKNGNSNSNETSALPICLPEMDKLRTPLDVKQRIIQKWLENVPSIISDENESKPSDAMIVKDFREMKILSETPSRKLKEVETDKITTLKEAVEISKNFPKQQDKKKPSTKSRPPPPPLLPNQIVKSLNETSKKTIEELENSKILKHKKSQNDTDFTIKTSTPQLKAGPISDCEYVAMPKSSNHPPSPPPLPTNKHKEETPRSSKKDFTPSNVSKNLMDAVIQELSGFNKNDKIRSKLFSNQEFGAQITADHIKQKAATNKNKGLSDTAKEQNTDSERRKGNIQVEKLPQHAINPNASEITRLQGKSIESERKNSAESSQDGHEYETILLNSDLLSKGKRTKSMGLNPYNLPEFFSKNDKHEGYSLVSEVYVNDEYSFCSGESPSSSYSNSSLEPEKGNVNVLDNHSGCLTIQVKSSNQHKQNYNSESDNFEPDTLERKQNKSKLIQRINEKNEEDETYINQKIQSEQENKTDNENFTDSLERPTIMLKTNGSFKRNSCEKDIDDLIFKNLPWTRMDSFGSLREIYEAKSKRRTETTSLVDFANNDADCISTLSWGEERRNKLLHRGIILHINESGNKKHKKGSQQKSHTEKNDDSKRVRPLGDQKSGINSDSRSASPVLNSLCSSSTSKNSTKVLTQNLLIPLKNHSPPLPPPRSISTVSPVAQLQARSVTSSPDIEEKNLLNKKHSSLSLTPSSAAKQKCEIQNHSNSCLRLPQVHTVPVFQELHAPPRPPKIVIDKSPPLPPRAFKPPLPPKSSKKMGHKINSSKFATRPLPPLPKSKMNEDSCSPPIPNFKDLGMLSTIPGASLDSPNSFEYESFYTTPYEEEFRFVCDKDESLDNSTMKTPLGLDNSNNTLTKETYPQERLNESKSWGNKNTAMPKKVEDSGYLSPDSNESYYPQIILTPQISKIPEKAESLGSQNSETEESFCDGESESGAESIATDSFFYGNFKKECFQNCLENYVDAPTHPQSPKGKPMEEDSNIQIHCHPITLKH